MSAIRLSEFLCSYTIMLLILMSNVGDSKPADVTTLQQNSTLQASSTETKGLLDLNDFHFLLNPIKHHSTADNKLFLLFLVHSSPNHFDQRRIIRETWGSTSVILDRSIRVVFLLGQTHQLNSDNENKVNDIANGGDHQKLFESFEDLVKPHRSTLEIPEESENSDKLIEPHLELKATKWNKVTNKEKEVRRNRKAINSKVLQKDPMVMDFHQLQSRVVQESLEHGDILQGSFVDSPRNSSYKHMMGLKWVHAAQDKPVFIIKTEDDVFVEMFHLVKFVAAIYGENPSNSLVCDVVPQGAKESYGHTGVGANEPFAGEDYHDHIGPLASDIVSLPSDGSDSNVSEDRSGGDSEDQSPLELYPEHCSSMAFLMTPDLAGRFLEASRDIHPTELMGQITSTDNTSDISGDIYVTGLLRESLRLRPFYLNLRFAHENKSYVRWLRGPSRLPLPFLFAAVDATEAGWQNTARELWEKTVRVHEGSL